MRNPKKHQGLLSGGASQKSLGKGKGGKKRSNNKSEKKLHRKSK